MGLHKPFLPQVPSILWSCWVLVDVLSSRLFVYAPMSPFHEMNSICLWWINCYVFCHCIFKFYFQHFNFIFMIMWKFHSTTILALIPPWAQFIWWQTTSTRFSHSVSKRKGFRHRLKDGDRGAANISFAVNDFDQAFRAPFTWAQGCFRWQFINPSPNPPSLFLNANSQQYNSNSDRVFTITHLVTHSEWFCRFIYFFRFQVQKKFKWQWLQFQNMVWFLFDATRWVVFEVFFIR